MTVGQHSRSAKRFIDIFDDKGSQVGTVAVEDDRVLIGRLSSADITLPDKSVSRRHAELYVDALGRWWIHDLGSRNGTSVNGELLDRALRPGDTIQIGKYELRTQLAPDRQPLAAVHKTSTPAEFVETTSSGTSVLHEMQPKLDSSHMDTLAAFGHRLYDIGDDAERMQALCDLIVRRDFRGRWATVLRIARNGPEELPEVLCQGISREEPHDGSRYVSKTVLRELRQHDAAILASNVMMESVLQLSVSSGASPMCVIACPLWEDTETRDALYAIFPSPCAKGEWLALVALAAKQYQYADANWLARKRARENALFEAELERGHEMQMRLVPKRPQAKGLDLALHFEPCRCVGGDYIDVLPTADGRVFLTVADVAGKGLQAALVATSLHTLVHASLCAGTDLSGLTDHLGCRADERSIRATACHSPGPRCSPNAYLCEH